MLGLVRRTQQPEETPLEAKQQLRQRVAYTGGLSCRLNDRGRTQNQLKSTSKPNSEYSTMNTQGGAL